MAFAIPLVAVPRGRSEVPLCCLSNKLDGGPVFSRPVRQSLPTHRERRFLYDNFVSRKGRGRSQGYANLTAFSLKVRFLCERSSPDDIGETVHEDSPHDEESLEEPQELPGPQELLKPPEEPGELKLLEQPEQRTHIPSWAYIVHVVSPKASLGKRAVVRNRAKRRIRAALRQVMPQHAHRGYEYFFIVHPEALTISFQDLLDEVRYALLKTKCWQKVLKDEQLRRPMYCKPS